MTKDEALKMAGYDLDGVIADVEKFNGFDNVCLQTIKRVRNVISEALEQSASLGDFNRMSKEECVDYIEYLRKEIDLLTFKEWQGLTDDEIANLNLDGFVDEGELEFARAIEQALKEKNHG